MLILLLPVSPAISTAFVYSLQKRLKNLIILMPPSPPASPLQTPIPDNIRNQTDESVLLVDRTHFKFASVFRHNGWKDDDPVWIDGIDVGVIDLIPEPHGHGSHKGTCGCKLTLTLALCPIFSINRCSKKLSRTSPFTALGQTNENKN